MSGITATTNIIVLLTTMQAKLVSDGIFNEPNVYFGLRPEIPAYPLGDHFCVITPGEEKPEDPVVIGGGLVTYSTFSEVYLTLWTRLALDQYPEAGSYLTNPYLGALSKIECVIVSMLVGPDGKYWFPADANGNWLLQEPLKLLKRSQPKMEKDVVGWGSITTTWQARYLNELVCQPTGI